MFVMLLVVGILAVLAAIWIPILVWLRRRSRAVAEQLATELQGETVVRAPENGSYRGATVPGYPVVKNNGLIALTQRRLIFRTLTGKAIDVPVEAITGVREATVFKGSVVGGQKHLIVETAAGEIGFYVFPVSATGSPPSQRWRLTTRHRDATGPRSRPWGSHAADCWDLTVDQIRQRAPELTVLAVDLPGRRGKTGDLFTAPSTTGPTRWYPTSTAQD